MLAMRLLPLPGVFRPHSDSWMLARHLAAEPLRSGDSVLDLCTGSGVLALSAARRGAGRVVAVDVSRRAIAATRINAALNGVTVQALRGNLFEPVGGERFQLIASNPPYLPSVDGEPPGRGPARAWEAGADGRHFLDKICAEAADHLLPGGALLLVHSSVCGEQRTLEALSTEGLEPRVIERQRGRLGPRLEARQATLAERGLLLDGEEEMVVIRAVRRA